MGYDTIQVVANQHSWVGNNMVTIDGPNIWLWSWQIDRSSAGGGGYCFHATNRQNSVVDQTITVGAGGWGAGGVSLYPVVMWAFERFIVVVLAGLCARQPRYRAACCCSALLLTMGDAWNGWLSEVGLGWAQLDVDYVLAQTIVFIGIHSTASITAKVDQSR